MCLFITEAHEVHGESKTGRRKDGIEGREDVGREQICYDCEMASHGVVPQIKTAVWLP